MTFVGSGGSQGVKILKILFGSFNTSKNDSTCLLQWKQRKPPFVQLGLASLEVTLLENCLEGQVGPGGNGYATDAEPLKAPFLRSPTWIFREVSEYLSISNAEISQFIMDEYYLCVSPTPNRSRGLKGYVFQVTSLILERI